jgi:hypothetical protein
MFELALGSAWSFWMIPIGCGHLFVCMLLSLKQDKERRKEFIVGEFFFPFAWWQLAFKV